MIRKVTVLSAFVISILWATFLLSPNVTLTTAVAQGCPNNRCYAGGYWSTGKYGVYAQIYTINPSIYNDPFIWPDFVAEWDTILFSYSPVYFVQVGYSKGEDTGNVLKYYREKYDGSGHDLYFFGDGPSQGTWHSYQITYVSGGQYTFYIDTGSRGSYTVNPYTPIELQAFVETTNTHITINGSWFKQLSYYDGRTWPLWLSLTTYSTPPYSVTKISNSEFKASGGG